MTELGEAASNLARRLNYTEWESEEMAATEAEKAGDAISKHCEEPRLDEICHALSLDTEELDNPAQEITAQDIALAAWSNWGAGTVNRATRKSTLSEGQFIVLNDYFNEIVDMVGGESV